MDEKSEEQLRPNAQPIHRWEEFLQGRDEVMILHGDERHRLRLTPSDKLILST